MASLYTDQELPLQTPIYTTAALNIVKGLSHKNLTLDQVNDLLRGLNSANIKNYYNVEGYGAARHWARGEVQRLFIRLLMECALEEYPVVNKSGVSPYIKVSSIYSGTEVCLLS